MLDQINDVFESKIDTTTSGGRELPGTAQLTAVATQVALNIMKQIESDFATHKDRVNLSKHDTATLDGLIEEFGNLDSVDVSFLSELSEETLNSMLKSQQSKRSRSKSKTMTIENYRVLMTAAIAETLIRDAAGMEKLLGRRRSGGSVVFSDEELVELEADQETLRRALRNIQSKKSIMKTKADFDEESQAWKDLLTAEAQLKEIRVENVRSDSTKKQLGDLLIDVDVDNIKSADAKALLDKVKELLK